MSIYNTALGRITGIGLIHPKQKNIAKTIARNHIVLILSVWYLTAERERAAMSTNPRLLGSTGVLTKKETLFEDYENACAFLSYCNVKHSEALLDVVDAEDTVNEAEAALRAYLTGAE